MLFCLGSRLVDILKTSSVLIRLLPLTLLWTESLSLPVLPNLQYLFCSLPRLVTTGWCCSLYKSTTLRDSALWPSAERGA